MRLTAFTRFAEERTGRTFGDYTALWQWSTTEVAELGARLRRRLREEYSPRHVPDRIIVVGSIPLTRSGKKMEVPVRRLPLGAAPAAVAGPSAMADPSALTQFVEYARTQRDYSLA